MQAIAYGIHAPNPHNTQAWKFKLTSDTEALFYIDERRLLPVTDPPARQIHIGAGCCIETLAVGMSRHGYDTAVEYLPQGSHGLEQIGRKPVARIMLRPNATTRADPLADAIGRRQTNRKPYTGPLLTAAEAEQLRGQVSSDEVEVLTRIWFRFNERQRRTHRDGLSIPQTGTDGLKRRLVEWTLRNGNPNHQSDWLKVGRAFARLQLALTQLGLTSHGYSQVLQEYPEMAKLQAEFNQLLGVRQPEKIQMAVRVGRAERAYVALRRDPQDLLIDSTPSSQ
ncbi:MAG TPA: hypothetical protein VIV12_04870 [Streptosporangiaceae bacterium]